MIRILPLLMLSCCVRPAPVEEPARRGAERWIVISRPEGVFFERERLLPAEVRLEIRCPLEVSAGSVAALEVRVVDPEPGVRYRLEASSIQPGVELLGPASVRVGGEWGRFRIRRLHGGRGGVVVTAVREKR